MVSVLGGVMVSVLGGVMVRVLGGVMVSVLVLSVVDLGLSPNQV